MAGVNTNVNERINASRTNTGGDVTSRQGPAQEIQVQQREGVTTQQQPSGGNEYAGNQYRQAYESSQSPSYDLSQSVASEMASRFAAQPRQQSQERPATQEQTHQARHFARMAGIDAESVRQGSPEEERDAVSFDVMSARPDQTGTFDMMTDANAELARARSNSNGLLSAPYPSAMATDFYERQKIKERSDREIESVRQESRGLASAPVPSTMAMETLDRFRETSENSPVIDDSKPTYDYSLRNREPRTKLPSQKRPVSIRKKEKDKASRAFKRSGVGRRIFGKVIGKPSLGFRDIGIGIQDMMAVIRQNPEAFNRLLSKYSDEPVDVTGWSSDQIIDYLKKNEVYVGTAKPPDNQFEDAQTRRLLALEDEQRGIYLHPIVVAIYTADIDGDEMNVSFDVQDAMIFSDPMNLLIGISGKQNLNTDFLPVAEIVGEYEPNKTDYDYVREVIFSAFSQIDGRTFRPLVEAVLELGKTSKKDGDAQSEAWEEVFRCSREVANIVTNNKENASNDLMSRLCEAVYSGMRDLVKHNVQKDAGSEILTDEQLPDIRAYDDSVLYKVLDGIVRGEAPRNFQDLRVAMHGFLGNIKGKNAPFRFTADIGKLMKMDSRLRLSDGSYEVDPNDDYKMQLFFESTMEYASSYRMSIEIKKAGRSEYYTQRMRSEVINEVGFPERYETYQDFLNRFCVSYRRHSAIINESNLVYDTRMGISSSSNRGIVSPLNESDGGVTLSDLAEPLVSIYGTYSVGRMFNKLSTSGIMGENVDSRWKGTPGHDTKLRARGSDVSKPYEREYEYSNSEFWVTGKYQSWNLRKFKNENRLLRGDIGERIRDVKIDSMSMDDATAELYMLLCIADKQTGAASRFNESVYGLSSVGDRGASRGVSRQKSDNTTVSMMSELLVELNRLAKQEGNTRDQMLYMNDVIDTLIMSGPDMFTHFGMDSPRFFLESELSRKMIQYANNTEVLGGIRTAMVFDLRMERINDILANMPDPNEHEQYLYEYNDLNFAIDELAASSEVWHGIVSEMKAEGSPMMQSVFEQLTSKRTPTKTSISGETYKWEGEHFYEAMGFWSNPGNHDSLRSVIEDLDMERDLKWKIIADVVRYWENDAYLKSWEVGYQMEIGNNAAYSLNSFSSQGALSTYYDFEESFNRWGKRSMENVRKNINDAAKKYRNKPGILTRTLQNLDQRPWELISIRDEMYADSILSVFDKDYAQSEKAKQQPWTNQLFLALSFQRNGGQMNDITYTDDRLLGVQSVESVGLEDVIHILANPSEELWLYNDVGQLGMVTRDLLLSSALDRDFSQKEVTEKDIWDFLQQEPRIASAIRKHVVSSITDSEGTAYVGASLSTQETMTTSDRVPNPLDHVKYLLRDHPTYAAIISMAAPKRGKVTRNERSRVTVMENYLAQQIYRYASSRMTTNGAAEVILEDLGITRESLESILTPNFDRYLSMLSLPIYEDGEARETAEEIYNQAASDLTRYIDEVRQNVPLRQPVPSSPAERPGNIGPDVSSVASFWDVIQELSGAKTMVSTGVEGAETHSYARWASKIFTSIKDRYADLEAIFDDVTGQEWNGMATNLRNPDGSQILIQIDEDGRFSNYRAIMRAKRDQGVDEVVVTVPDSYVIRDRSTDTFGQPVTSPSMYMISKRANGAETNNLKAKKSGIDGKDSITKKNGKYRLVDDGTGSGNKMRANFFDIEYNLRQLHQQNGEQGLNVARQELAIMLWQENSDLGYDDLTLANYMNIADLMLIEDEDGVLHLRSLEMLFSAVKYRIGADVDELSDQEFRDKATAIMTDNTETGVGISRMTSLEAFDNIRPKSMAMSSTAIRSYSSSFVRNYDLLSSIRSFAQGIGVEPISPNIAESINERMRSIDEIKSMADTIDVARNYNIIGYAGTTNGSEELNWSIGASNSIMIGNGDISDHRVSEICYKAFELGMTVFVGARNVNKIPTEFVPDVMPCSDDGSALIPCFDMRLNGAEAMPYNGGRFAIMQIPPSAYTMMIEDPVNIFELGDAQYKATRHYLDRIDVIDSDSVQMTATSMFPNVYNNLDYSNRNILVSFASYNDIITQIVSKGVRCTIDYGVVKGGDGFDQRVHDVNEAIKRYCDRFQDTNADGQLVGVDCEPGDIVGWMELEIHNPYTDESQYVLSPIIPFPLHGSTKNIPEKFRVEQLVTVDDDNTVIAVDWTNSSKLDEGGYVKAFGSSGSANKGMMSLSSPVEQEVRLLDGTMVDIYGAEASTVTRKIGTDKRIKSMMSLMAHARLHGYNFARTEGSFPTDEDHPYNEFIKECLLVHDSNDPGISSIEWRGFLRDGVLFTRDERLNAFLNYECMKILEDGGNPSDYLANVYEDSDGNEHRTQVMWEFKAMFELGMSYEDNLLHFLHTMDSELCPDNLDDEGDDYLYRLSKKSGYDFGVLEVKAPFPMEDGRTLYFWATPTLGLSFFGEEYSGFSRPNVNGASNFMDAMNTYSYKGVRLDERSERFMNMWATSDLGRRMSHSSGIVGKA